MDKNKLSVTQQLAYTDAVSYLEALLESFKAGQIVVAADGEQVTLSPREHVEVTVEAKSKKDKQKFSLELGWSYPPAVQVPAVSISAEAPCCCDDVPCDVVVVACDATCDEPVGNEAAPVKEDAASSEDSAAPESPAMQEPQETMTGQEQETVCIPAEEPTAPAAVAKGKRTGKQAGKRAGARKASTRSTAAKR